MPVKGKPLPSEDIRYKLLDSDSDQHLRKGQENKEKSKNISSIYYGLTPGEIGDFFSMGTDPKYIVIKAVEEKQKAIDINPFLIKKVLEGITKSIKSFKPTREGSYLILVSNTVAAEKVIASFANGLAIGSVKCNAKYHEKLNNSQGSIRAPLLKNLSEAEVLEGLQASNPAIIKVRHLTRMIEGRRTNTGTVHITFNTYNVPRYITMLYEKVEVATWYPSPLRCRKCFQLGHHEARCRNTSVCPQCGEAKAAAEEGHKCRRVHCVSCGTGSHDTLDRNCPAFIREKQIVKIQIDRHLSRFDARRTFYATHGPAEEASNTTPATATNNLTAQTQSLKKPTVSYAQAVKATPPQPIQKTNTKSDTNTVQSTNQVQKITDTYTLNTPHSDYCRNTGDTCAKFQH